MKNAYRQFCPANSQTGLPFLFFPKQQYHPAKCPFLMKKPRVKPLWKPFYLLFYLLS